MLSFTPLRPRSFTHRLVEFFVVEDGYDLARVEINEDTKAVKIHPLVELHFPGLPYILTQLPHPPAQSPQQVREELIPLLTAMFAPS